MNFWYWNCKIKNIKYEVFIEKAMLLKNEQRTINYKH